MVEGVRCVRVCQVLAEIPSDMFQGGGMAFQTPQVRVSYLSLPPLFLSFVFVPLPAGSTHLTDETDSSLGKSTDPRLTALEGAP